MTLLIYSQFCLNSAVLIRRFASAKLAKRDHNADDNRTTTTTKNQDLSSSNSLCIFVACHVLSLFVSIVYVAFSCSFCCVSYLIALLFVHHFKSVHLTQCKKCSIHDNDFFCAAFPVASSVIFGGFRFCRTQTYEAR